MTQPDFSPASPEGSAGLDAGKLIESLTQTAAWFEACANRDPIPSASLLAEAASWRALASALPSLIDAGRERDELKKQLADDGPAWDSRHRLNAKDVRIAQLEAQLTEARSRIAKLEVDHDRYRNQAEAYWTQVLALEDVIDANVRLRGTP